MTKAERIQVALKGGTPDKVPFLLNTVMQGVQERILGREITDPTYTGMNNAGWLGGLDETPEVVPALTCVPEVAEILGLDGIQIQDLQHPTHSARCLLPTWYSMPNGQLHHIRSNSTMKMALLSLMGLMI